MHCASSSDCPARTGDEGAEGRPAETSSPGSVIGPLAGGACLRLQADEEPPDPSAAPQGAAALVNSSSAGIDCPSEGPMSENEQNTAINPCNVKMAPWEDYLRKIFPVELPGAAPPAPPREESPPCCSPSASPPSASASNSSADEDDDDQWMDLEDDEDGALDLPKMVALSSAFSPRGLNKRHPKSSHAMASIMSKALEPPMGQFLLPLITQPIPDIMKVLMRKEGARFADADHAGLDPVSLALTNRLLQMYCQGQADTDDPDLPDTEEDLLQATSAEGVAEQQHLQPCQGALKCEEHPQSCKCSGICEECSSDGIKCISDIFSRVLYVYDDAGNQKAVPSKPSPICDDDDEVVMEEYLNSSSQCVLNSPQCASNNTHGASCPLSDMHCATQKPAASEPADNPVGSVKEDGPRSGCDKLDQKAKVRQYILNKRERESSQQADLGRAQGGVELQPQEDTPPLVVNFCEDNGDTQPPPSDIFAKDEPEDSANSSELKTVEAELSEMLEAQSGNKEPSLLEKQLKLEEETLIETDLKTKITEELLFEILSDLDALQVEREGEDEQVWAEDDAKKCDGPIEVEDIAECIADLTCRRQCIAHSIEAGAEDGEVNDGSCWSSGETEDESVDSEELSTGEEWEAAAWQELKLLLMMAFGTPYADKAAFCIHNYQVESSSQPACSCRPPSDPAADEKLQILVCYKDRSKLDICLNLTTGKITPIEADKDFRKFFRNCKNKYRRDDLLNEVEEGFPPPCTVCGCCCSSYRFYAPAARYKQINACFKRLSGCPVQLIGLLDRLASALAERHAAIFYTIMARKCYAIQLVRVVSWTTRWLCLAGNSSLTGECKHFVSIFKYIVHYKLSVLVLRPALRRMIQIYMSNDSSMVIGAILNFIRCLWCLANSAKMYHSLDDRLLPYCRNRSKIDLQLRYMKHRFKCIKETMITEASKLQIMNQSDGAKGEPGEKDVLTEGGFSMRKVLNVLVEAVLRKVTPDKDQNRQACRELNRLTSSEVLEYVCHGVHILTVCLEKRTSIIRYLLGNIVFDTFNFSSSKDLEDRLDIFMEKMIELKAEVGSYHFWVSKSPVVTYMDALRDFGGMLEDVTNIGDAELCYALIRHTSLSVDNMRYLGLLLQDALQMQKGVYPVGKIPPFMMDECKQATDEFFKKVAVFKALLDTVRQKSPTDDPQNFDNARMEILEAMCTKRAEELNSFLERAKKIEDILPAYAVNRLRNMECEDACKNTVKGDEEKPASEAKPTNVKAAHCNSDDNSQTHTPNNVDENMQNCFNTADDKAKNPYTLPVWMEAMVVKDQERLQNLFMAMDKISASSSPSREELMIQQSPTIDPLVQVQVKKKGEEVQVQPAPKDREELLCQYLQQLGLELLQHAWADTPWLQEKYGNDYILPGLMHMVGELMEAEAHAPDCKAQDFISHITRSSIQCVTAIVCNIFNSKASAGDLTATMVTNLDKFNIDVSKLVGRTECDIPQHSRAPEEPGSGEELPDTDTLLDDLKVREKEAEKEDNLSLSSPKKRKLLLPDIDLIAKEISVESFYEEIRAGFPQIFTPENITQIRSKKKSKVCGKRKSGKRLQLHPGFESFAFEAITRMMEEMDVKYLKERADASGKHSCDPTPREVLAKIIADKQCEQPYTEIEFKIHLSFASSQLVFRNVRWRILGIPLAESPAPPAGVDRVDGFRIEDYWERVRFFFPRFRTMAITNLVNIEIPHLDDLKVISDDAQEPCDPIKKRAVKKTVGNAECLKISASAEQTFFIEKLQSVNRRLLHKNFTSEDLVSTMSELQQLEKKLKYAVNVANTAVPAVTKKINKDSKDKDNCRSCVGEDASEAEILAAKGLSMLINARKTVNPEKEKIETPEPSNTDTQTPQSNDIDSAKPEVLDTVEKMNSKLKQMNLAPEVKKKSAIHLTQTTAGGVISTNTIDSTRHAVKPNRQPQVPANVGNVSSSPATSNPAEIQQSLLGVRGIATSGTATQTTVGAGKGTCGGVTQANIGGAKVSAIIGSDFNKSKNMAVLRDNIAAAGLSQSLAKSAAVLSQTMNKSTQATEINPQNKTAKNEANLKSKPIDKDTKCNAVHQNVPNKCTGVPQGKSLAPPVNKCVGVSPSGASKCAANQNIPGKCTANLSAPAKCTANQNPPAKCTANQKTGKCEGKDDGAASEVTIVNGVAMKDGVPIKDGVTIRDIIGMRPDGGKPCAGPPPAPAAASTPAQSQSQPAAASSASPQPSAAAGTAAAAQEHNQKGPCVVNHGESCGAEEGRCARHPEQSRPGLEHPCSCCYCTVFGHAPPVSTPVPRKYNETRERLRSILNRKKQRSRPPLEKEASVTGSAASKPAAEASSAVTTQPATAAAAANNNNAPQAGNTAGNQTHDCKPVVGEKRALGAAPPLPQAPPPASIPHPAQPPQAHTHTQTAVRPAQQLQQPPQPSRTTPARPQALSKKLKDKLNMEKAAERHAVPPAAQPVFRPPPSLPQKGVSPSGSSPPPSSRSGSSSSWLYHADIDFLVQFIEGEAGKAKRQAKKQRQKDKKVGLNQKQENPNQAKDTHNKSHRGSGDSLDYPEEDLREYCQTVRGDGMVTIKRINQHQTIAIPQGMSVAPPPPPPQPPKKTQPLSWEATLAQINQLSQGKKKQQPQKAKPPSVVEAKTKATATAQSKNTNTPAGGAVAADKKNPAAPQAKQKTQPAPPAAAVAPADPPAVRLIETQRATIEAALRAKHKQMLNHTEIVLSKKQLNKALKTALDELQQQVETAAAAARLKSAYQDKFANKNVKASQQEKAVNQGKAASQEKQSGKGKPAADVKAKDSKQNVGSGKAKQTSSGANTGAAATASKDKNKDKRKNSVEEQATKKNANTKPVPAPVKGQNGNVNSKPTAASNNQQNSNKQQQAKLNNQNNASKKKAAVPAQPQQQQQQQKSNNKYPDRIKLNPDTTIEIANRAPPPPPAASAEEPGGAGKASCSIMEQLRSGVQVSQLRLPPGITLTWVDPNTQHNSSHNIPSVKMTSCLPPPSRPTPPQPPTPAVIMVDTKHNLQDKKAAQPPESQIPKSKKSKKKNKKQARHAVPLPQQSMTSTHSISSQHITSNLSTQHGAKPQHTMVTLRNPMFHPSMSLPLPEPIPMPPCQATITATSNGMFTIRNPLMSMVHQQNMLNNPTADKQPPTQPSLEMLHQQSFLLQGERDRKQKTEESMLDLAGRMADLGFQSDAQTGSDSNHYSLFKPEKKDCKADIVPNAATAASRFKNPIGSRVTENQDAQYGEMQGHKDCHISNADKANCVRNEYVNKNAYVTDDHMKNQEMRKVYVHPMKAPEQQRNEAYNKPINDMPFNEYMDNLRDYNRSMQKDLIYSNPHQEIAKKMEGLVDARNHELGKMYQDGGDGLQYVTRDSPKGNDLYRQESAGYTHKLQQTNKPSQIIPPSYAPPQVTSPGVHTSFPPAEPDAPGPQFGSLLFQSQATTNNHHSAIGEPHKTPGWPSPGQEAWKEDQMPLYPSRPNSTSSGIDLNLSSDSLMQQQQQKISAARHLAFTSPQFKQPAPVYKEDSKPIKGVNMYNAPVANSRDKLQSRYISEWASPSMYSAQSADLPQADTNNQYNINAAPGYNYSKTNNDIEGNFSSYTNNLSSGSDHINWSSGNSYQQEYPTFFNHLQNQFGSSYSRTPGMVRSSQSSSSSGGGGGSGGGAGSGSRYDSVSTSSSNSPSVTAAEEPPEPHKADKFDNFTSRYFYCGDVDSWTGDSGAGLDRFEWSGGGSGGKGGGSLGAIGSQRNTKHEEYMRDGRGLFPGLDQGNDSVLHASTKLPTRTHATSPLQDTLKRYDFFDMTDNTPVCLPHHK